MVGGLTLSEREVDNTINAQLGDVLKLLGTQVLAQFHREARRQVLLILDVVRRVQSNA